MNNTYKTLLRVLIVHVLVKRDLLSELHMFRQLPAGQREPLERYTENHRRSLYEELLRCRHLEIYGFIY